MTLLTRDAILRADDRPTERVFVPEWGGEVIVRGMTVRDRDAFETEALRTKRRGKGRPNGADDDATANLDNFRARLVMRCVVDAKGNRLFPDTDADALGAKAASAVDRVFGIAQRLCGMSAQDVEELTGNFDETRGDGGSSESPSPSGAPSVN